MLAMLRRIGALSLSLSFLVLSSCQTGVAGNEGGSIPLNETETIEYKQAINRCYKIGGTRVVKIMGELRCY